MDKFVNAGDVLEKIFALVDFENSPSTDSISSDTFGDGRISAAKDIIEIIKKEPPADVRPERNGHWNDYASEHFECSECYSISEFNSDFCPDCGAKMDRGYWLWHSKGRRR